MPLGQLAAVVATLASRIEMIVLRDEYDMTTLAASPYQPKEVATNRQLVEMSVLAPVAPPREFDGVPAAARSEGAEDLQVERGDAATRHLNKSLA